MVWCFIKHRDNFFFFLWSRSRFVTDKWQKL
jgi:hypothetical protein